MTMHMVELTVSDWPRSVEWYTAALGLTVELSDAANGFALLAGDGAKLALKAGVPVPGGVKLHWRVPDLAAAVERLTAAGVAVGPLKASAEGYTRAAVTDPDGYAVVVFAWDG